MQFSTADSLTINTNRNVTAPKQLVKQLQYVAYL